MNINKLADEIASKYGICAAYIFTKSRRKEAILTARKILYKVLLLSGKSTTQVGMILNRDHSTVAVMAKTVDKDDELREYATYLYLKYRDTPEISKRVDIDTAKKVIFNKIKEYYNSGKSLTEISSKIDLSEKIVSGIIMQIKKNAPNARCRIIKTEHTEQFIYEV